MIIHGSNDDIIPPASVDKLAEKISSQKNITLDYRTISGADHFFQEHMAPLGKHFADYLDKSMTAAA
jgi:hypothetical protein